MADGVWGFRVCSAFHGYGGMGVSGSAKTLTPLPPLRLSLYYPLKGALTPFPESRI